jgi:hypothetical protein
MGQKESAAGQMLLGWFFIVYSQCVGNNQLYWRGQHVPDVFGLIASTADLELA